MSNLTKEELRSRITQFASMDNENGYDQYVEQNLKQLIKDVMTSIVPEKATTRQLDDANNYEFAVLFKLNQAIDTIHKNVEELLS